jgi:hypothetical protein
MEFEIKKGVPLPRSKGKPRKYDLPLEDLEVDEHIHIPNKKFTVRQLSDGIGIWRTK